MREHEQGLAPEPGSEGLLAADAAALDALMEAGLDADAAVGAGAEEARVRQVAALLSLLRPLAAAPAALADETLARVLRVQHEANLAAARDAEPTLSSDDEAALEAWVMGGFDADRVPTSLRDRARKHEALAALATTGPAFEGMEALRERTLALVQAEVGREAEALTIGAARRPGIRLADIVSVAAVLLIGCGVLFPVLGSMREQSRRAICNTNMTNTAVAMGTYAGSNRDSMPVANASLSGGKWWDVGVPSAPSNSANLYTLARDGYLPLADLACPGNPAAPTAPAAPGAHDWRRLEEVSYSYQIMFGPRPAWNGGKRIPVLADRSPVILRAFRGEPIDPHANAPNHRGAGQHLLYNDGTVSWASSPVLESGDNIWLPRAIENRLRLMSGTRLPNPLQGTELPDAVDDACLGP